MAARLRSITSPILWSLLLKPLAVAAAWLFLPHWIFILVAIYFYLVPLFRPGPMLGAFAAFLFLARILPTSLIFAAYGAVVFGLILGIKDLVIVNRRQAYKFLVFLLSFAGFMTLFGYFGSWSTPQAFWALGGSCLMWLWLALSFPAKLPESEDEPESEPESKLRKARTILGALLLFEVGSIIFFLPLSFFSQGALLFFGSALILEVLEDRSLGKQKKRTSLFLWVLTYAILSFLLIFLTPWKI